MVKDDSQVGKAGVRDEDRVVVHPRQMCVEKIQHGLGMLDVSCGDVAAADLFQQVHVEVLASLEPQFSQLAHNPDKLFLDCLAEFLKVDVDAEVANLFAGRGELVARYKVHVAIKVGGSSFVGENPVEQAVDDLSMTRHTR